MSNTEHNYNNMYGTSGCFYDFLNSLRSLLFVFGRTPAAGALMVTAYYEERQKWREAMEFLIMAKCSDKALELAMRENKMEAFTDLVGDSISPECAARVAQYYETLQVDIPKAGKFYSFCGQVSSVSCIGGLDCDTTPTNDVTIVYPPCTTYARSVPSSLEPLSSVRWRQARAGCCCRCRWKSQK